MTYEKIDGILMPAGMGAAEAHGIATGMLCADSAADCDKWLQRVAQAGAQSQLDENHSREILAKLFDETQRHLEEENFEFDLFLPADDSPLASRAEALADWCKGFLYGLGMSLPGGELPEDSSEILHDLVDISKLDSDAEGADDEAAFSELNEYIRVGIQLVRAELRRRLGRQRMH